TKCHFLPINRMLAHESFRVLVYRGTRKDSCASVRASYVETQCIASLLAEPCLINQLFEYPSPQIVPYIAALEITAKSIRKIIQRHRLGLFVSPSVWYRIIGIGYLGRPIVDMHLWNDHAQYHTWQTMAECRSCRNRDLICIVSDQIEGVFGRSVDASTFKTGNIAVFVRKPPGDGGQGVRENILFIDGHLDL